MRRSYLLVALCACSFHEGAALHGDGATGSGDATNTPGPHMWTVDSAADFQRGDRIDLGVDPSGALTPAGYFYGGWALHGADTAQLWAAGASSYTVDPYATATGHALWTGVQISSQRMTDLSTVGVTGDTFSMWAIGEVYLPSGAHTFSLTGGAVAFMEIAPPHSSTFTQLVVSTGGTAATAPFTAASDGWYQIRVGFTASGAPWNLDLQDTLPGQTAPRRFGRAEMRAREEEGRGLMQNVYNHQLLTTSGGFGPHQLSTDALASLTPPLYGQPGQGGAFSAHWAGQFYAAAAGSYVLQLQSNAGNRIAAAGQGSASHWVHDDGTASTSTVTLDSTGPGWYDVAFDINEPLSASVSASLVVMSGPELAGMPLPVDRLRAVETNTDRLASTSFFANGPGQFIPDRGNTTVTIPQLQAWTTETPTSIAVRVGVYNPEYGSGSLGFTLYDPAGQGVSLDATAYTTASNVATYYWTVDASQFSAPSVAGGSWKIYAQDFMQTSNNIGGAIYDAELTVHTANGLDPLQTDGTWTSEVIDAGELVSVEKVSWMERATAMPAKVQLRACDAACTTEAWLDASNGGALAIGSGHRYLQARIEIFSDGKVAPEFDQLVVNYTSR